MIDVNDTDRDTLIINVLRGVADDAELAEYNRNMSDNAFRAASEDLKAWLATDGKEDAQPSPDLLDRLLRRLR